MNKRYVQKATIITNCDLFFAKTFFICFSITFLSSISSSTVPAERSNSNQAIGNSHSTMNGTSNETLVNSLHHSAAINNSATYNVASKISILLKILQIVNHMASLSSSPSLDKSDSQSESRSMTSWLGFHKIKSLPSSNRRNIYQSSYHDPIKSATTIAGTNDIYKPTFVPISSPNVYDGHVPFDKYALEPNPFLFLPLISDTSAIDYWLKFLEDPKIEEQIMPILWDDKKPDFGNIIYSHNNRQLSFNPPMKKIKKIKIDSRNSDHSRLNMKKFHNNNENIDYNSDYEDKWSFQNDVVGHDLETKSRTKKISKQVQNEYDTTPRCDKFTEDICIDDFEYPEHAILDEIFKRKDIFQLMYAEVNGDVPLVDGISKDMDESFSQDYYYSNNDNDDSYDYEGYNINGRPSNKSSFHDFDQREFNHQNQQQNNKNNMEQGYVCRSEVLYAKPKLAKNLKKKWRVIVNAGDFTQTIRLEKCNKANSECRYIADHKYASRCAQVNSIHRLLVFEKGKGFYIDSFRIPTACTCHVYSVKQQKPNYSGENSFHVVKRFKNKPKNFNNNPTFWSLINAANQKQTYKNEENNDKNQNKLFFISEQQQQQQYPTKRHQTISVLNNNEFLKLLPQLTSIESGNVLLQRLLEGISVTNNQQQQQQQQNLPNFKNRLIQPEYQLNLPEKFSDGNRQHMKMSEHLGMTSTIVTPSRGGQAVAPVVQVIHMPVSTGLVSVDSLDTGISNKMNTIQTWPFRSDHGDESLLSYSKYLTSASDNYSQSQSGSNSTSNSTMINLNDAMVISVRNETENETKTTDKRDEKNNDGDDDDDNKRDSKKMMDKKINFSYHPILEYIIN